MDQAKRRFGITGIIMIVIGIVLIALSLDIEGNPISDPSSARFIPFITSVILLICGFWTSLEERRLRSSWVDKEDEKVDSNSKKTLGYFFLVLVLYIISLSFIPFILASLLFLFVSFYLLKDISLKQNILISVITIAVIYVLFKEIFQIVFP